MTDTNNRGRWPIGVWAAVALTALMTWRLSAMSMLGEVGAAIPRFWGVAFRGDIFVGITAPIVTFLLVRRRDRTAWIIALIWHAVGIKDFIAGLEFHFIQPFDPALESAGLVLLVTGTALQLLAVALLVRHRSAFSCPKRCRSAHALATE